LPGGDVDACLRWLGALEILGEAGIGACQIREKDLSDRALLDLALRARAILPAQVDLLINGRIDVALAAGADGVHLPGDGLPIPPLRARFGREISIGRSTHALAEVERARDEGADYATFGPVYETPSKAAFGPPLGLEAFRRAARLGLPLFALGGVTLEHLAELAAAGAAGIAGIRIFQDVAALPRLVAATRSLFLEPVGRPRAD